MGAIWKGIRSLIKGALILGSFLTGFGMMGAYVVAGWNGLNCIYGAGKRNAKKFLGYGAGVLLSLFYPIPIPYAIGLEATGAYRIIAKRELFYDNPGNKGIDYVSSLYGLRI